MLDTKSTPQLNCVFGLLQQRIAELVIASGLVAEAEPQAVPHYYTAMLSSQHPASSIG